MCAVHKQVRHSHLSLCTFTTTDHCLEIQGASTSCPGLYGDSCTYTFQNNGNTLFIPPTSASTRTRFSHPEEGSSKFPETSKHTRSTKQKSNRRPSIDSDGCCSCVRIQLCVSNQDQRNSQPPIYIPLSLTIPLHRTGNVLDQRRPNFTGEGPQPLLGPVREPHA